MKRFFCYTLFLLCYQSLVCGAQVGDSTLYQLLQLPNDTERVNQIYQQGFNLRNADIELAFQYATVGLHVLVLYHYMLACKFQTRKLTPYYMPFHFEVWHLTKDIFLMQYKYVTACPMTAIGTSRMSILSCKPQTAKFRREYCK